MSIESLKSTRAMSLILSVALFIAIFDLPYGYYTFLRILVCLFSLIIIWIMYSNEKFLNPMIYGIIIAAILWNPISPIYLDKSTWIVFDSFGFIFYGYLAYLLTKYIKSNRIN